MNITFKIGTEGMNINLPEPNFRLVLKDVRAVLDDVRNCPDPIDAVSKLCIRLYQTNPSLHVGLRQLESSTTCVNIDLRKNEIEFAFSTLPADIWAFEQFAQLTDADLKRLASKCLASSN